MANSTGGAWRQKSTGFLATIAAIVLVVVLAGGMALGYAIEKNRVKSDKTTKTTAKKKTPAKKTSALSQRVKGTVDSITETAVTITAASGAKQKITITKTTQIVKVSAGALSDIAAKAKVLYIAKKGSFVDASAVVVMPATAKLGTAVVIADPNSMSLGTAQKPVKITITGARVEKGTVGTRADVAKGAKVVVGVVRTKAGGIATEILVVPNDSPFA